MSADREWLDGLQVGDDVIVDRDRSVYLSHVTRLTDTRIIVGARVFTKKDGYTFPREAWSRTLLRPPTAELREKAARRRALDEVRAAYQESRFEKLTTEELVTLSDWLKAVAVPR